MTNRDVKLNVASGAVSLKPSDLLSAISILVHDKDTDIRTAAKTSLAKIAPDVISKAITEGVEPEVLKEIAYSRFASESITLEIALTSTVGDDTLTFLAWNGPAKTASFIGGLKERIEKCPKIAEALQANKNLEPPTAAAPDNDDIGELSEEEEKKLLEAAEKAEVPEELLHDTPPDKPLNITQLLNTMNVTEKIKLAMTGNKEARGALIKSSNKLISTAVLKNARITDEEVINLTATKGTPDTLLRMVARDKEWMQSYVIRKNVITNPKTPLDISMRALNQLDIKDVENIARSKGVSSALASAAKKIVDSKQKKKH